ncbi:hypothetical protein PACTADRAFT_47470 [Pachysolen tannophilus NRRL Y-2460]|uniref:Protein YIP n=1 Tax=Pachysolen tannophilus NRRL Y-2460 TaxID=669874 RepID=A0A1E4U0X4_PACTA|nr:hypothetical protein PACTADRAFT_47470 [Pachysolen tannophilus NRRL Y-2460]
MAFNYNQQQNPQYNTYKPNNLEFYQYSGQQQNQQYAANSFVNPGLSGPMTNTFNPTSATTVGDLTGSIGDTQLSHGILAAFSTSGYPGEAPLLEELGINFQHIKMKTLAVLNFRSKNLVNNPEILGDSDLAGPILFGVMLGAFLLLNGKFHFSYIYGVDLIGIISLHQLFKLMANSEVENIDIIKTGSVIGYCLLPLVILSGINVVINLNNFLGYILTGLFIFWCTFSSSYFFMVAFKLSNVRILIAYPLAILYSIFALFIIF